MPKWNPATNSRSLAAAARTRANQYNPGRKSCAIRPTPNIEKQSAVLGVIGMYLARTLASSGSPEIQPANVRSRSRTAREAQISGSVGRTPFHQLLLHIRRPLRPNMPLCPPVSGYLAGVTLTADNLAGPARTVWALASPARTIER
jgi:hypothetical protein